MYEYVKQGKQALEDLQQLLDNMEKFHQDGVIEPSCFQEIKENRSLYEILFLSLIMTNNYDNLIDQIPESVVNEIITNPIQNPFLASQNQSKKRLNYEDTLQIDNYWSIPPEKRTAKAILKTIRNKLAHGKYSVEGKKIILEECQVRFSLPWLSNVVWQLLSDNSFSNQPGQSSEVPLYTIQYDLVKNREQLEKMLERTAYVRITLTENCPKTGYYLKDCLIAIAEVISNDSYFSLIKKNFDKKMEGKKISPEKKNKEYEKIVRKVFYELLQKLSERMNHAFQIEFLPLDKTFLQDIKLYEETFYQLPTVSQIQVVNDLIAANIKKERTNSVTYDKILTILNTIEKSDSEEEFYQQISVYKTIPFFIPLIKSLIIRAKMNLVLNYLPHKSTFQMRSQLPEPTFKYQLIDSNKDKKRRLKYLQTKLKDFKGNKQAKETLENEIQQLMKELSKEQSELTNMQVYHKLRNALVHDLVEEKDQHQSFEFYCEEAGKKTFKARLTIPEIEKVIEDTYQILMQKNNSKVKKKC